MENAQLSAERRQVLGKRVRFLRRQGLLPANLFGHGAESVPLQLPTREVELLLARIEGATFIKLAFDGAEPRPVLIKGIQRDPRRGQLLHVDFQQVTMTEKVRVEVPLRFVGEAPAVRGLGGTLLHSLTALEVQALPAHLPAHLVVNISGLGDFSDAIHVRDIPMPAGVEVLANLDELVVKVAPPRVAVEEVEAAAEAPEAPAPVAPQPGQEAAQGPSSKQG